MPNVETYKLSNLDLDEVSLVNLGANQKADVVLFKRAISAGKSTEGIQFNVGFKKSDGSSDVQCVIFDIAKFDRPRAEQWIKDHKMKIVKTEDTENSFKFHVNEIEQFEKFRVIQPGSQLSKAMSSDCCTLSFQQIQNAVDAALRAKYQSKTSNDAGYPGSGYLWIRDLYEDYAVFDQDGSIWECEYTLNVGPDGKPNVLMGDKYQVEIDYVPVGKKEPTDTIPVDRKYGMTEVVPVEMLFKIGQMNAQLAHIDRKFANVEKLAPNRHPDSGKYTASNIVSAAMQATQQAKDIQSMHSAKGTANTPDGKSQIANAHLHAANWHNEAANQSKDAGKKRFHLKMAQDHTAKMNAAISKGGPGSGRYPAGSGKSSHEDDFFNSLKTAALEIKRTKSNADKLKVAEKHKDVINQHAKLAGRDTMTASEIVSHARGAY